eukprot:Stramenopile-MAST_4_protein_4348
MSEDDEFDVGSVSRLSTTSGTEDGEEDQSLDRIRMLMLNYYGNEGEDDEDEENEEDRMHDLDGESFDVDSYFQDMLKSNDLSTLLRRSSEIKKENQSLDSDMQNMVYENYNKFIRATDTIKKMKDNVSVVETELDVLMQDMEQLEETSHIVDTTLAPNRDKIESMVSLQGLIKKLEFLFELPMRLKRSIELEAYVQAVKYYNTANVILEQYAHVLSFDSIHKESIFIMSGLKELMRKKLEEGNQSQSGMVDLVKLLMQMEEPFGEIMSTFLEWTKSKLLEFIDGVEIAAVKGREHELWDQSDSFIDFFSHFANDFRELFSNINIDHRASSCDVCDDESVSGPAPENALLMFTKEIFHQFFSKIRPFFVDFDIPPHLSADESSSLTPKFIESDISADEEAEALLSTVDQKEGGESDSHIAVSPTSEASEENEPCRGMDKESSETMPFESFVANLVRFRGSLAQVNDAVRGARLHDRLSELVEQSVRIQITNVFTALQAGMIARFVAVSDALLDASTAESKESLAAKTEAQRLVENKGNPFRTTDTKPKSEDGTNALDNLRVSSLPKTASVTFLSNTLASLVVSDVEYVLKNVKILLECCSKKERLISDMEQTFSDLVQGQLNHLFLWMASVIEDYCDGVGPLKENMPCASSSMLVLAVAIHDLATNGVTRCASILMECLPMVNERSSANKVSEVCVIFDLGSLMNTFSKASNKLLEHFVMLQGRLISGRVRASIFKENWLMSGDVIDVHPVMLSMVKESTEVGCSVASVWGETSRPMHQQRSITVTHGRQNLDQKGSVEGAIDRIFSQKTTVYGQIEFTSESVLEGIFKIVLKAMAESFRLQTFSKRGYQQIEVDANYLQNILRMLMHTKYDNVAELAIDMMMSASERCLNPEHVPMAQIQSIVCQHVPCKDN